MNLYVMSVMGYNPDGQYWEHHADYYVAKDRDETLDAAKSRFLQKHPGWINLRMSHYEIESGMSLRGIDGKFYTIQLEERKS